MRVRSLSVLAFVCLAAVSVCKPAASADMARETPLDWTGFYAGVSAGAGQLSTGWSNATFGNYSSTVTGSGGLIGGTLGQNLQQGSWVFGIEGDASLTNMNVSIFDCFPSCTAQMNWLATVRGRVGTLAINPRLLLFGTAGLAFAGEQDVVTSLSTLASTEFGWTAGGGLEYQFHDGWSGKLEFLHADFGSHLSCPAGPCTYNNFVDFVSADILRVGINRHF